MEHYNDIARVILDKSCHFLEANKYKFIDIISSNFPKISKYLDTHVSKYENIEHSSLEFIFPVNAHTLSIENYISDELEEFANSLGVADISFKANGIKIKKYVSTYMSRITYEQHLKFEISLLLYTYLLFDLFESARLTFPVYHSMNGLITVFRQANIVPLLFPDSKKSFIKDKMVAIRNNVYYNNKYGEPKLLINNVSHLDDSTLKDVSEYSNIIHMKVFRILSRYLELENKDGSIIHIPKEQYKETLNSVDDLVAVLMEDIDNSIDEYINLENVYMTHYEKFMVIEFIIVNLLNHIYSYTNKRGRVNNDN